MRGSAGCHTSTPQDDPEAPKYVRFQLNTVPAVVGAFTLCHIGEET